MPISPGNKNVFNMNVGVKLCFLSVMSISWHAGFPVSMTFQLAASNINGLPLIRDITTSARQEINGTIALFLHLVRALISLWMFRIVRVVVLIYSVPLHSALHLMFICLGGKPQFLKV
jgi:hypothetical protein